MNNERREHLRVTLSVKSALYCPFGFLVNVPVADISSGGLRLDIPILDQRFSGQKGLLKLFFQPGNSFPEMTYTLEIPCRLVWMNGQGAGIEFLNADPVLRSSLDDLVQSGRSALSQEDGHSQDC
ncbi:MAG: PilZ domain-containing protein [Magnetococcales bacterium]|nr:PilZ domain-containing protein [Magnetococcales bacterium]